MIYTITKIICRIVYGWIFGTKVIGAENIPERGAFIMAANHLSNWDPPFLGTFIKREIYYMGKEELFRNPIFAWWIRGLHVFPVKRGAADKTAIKTALTVLKGGHCLGIFPEGTRSKTGKIGKAEPGVSLIAAMTNVPIIPTAIVNTDKIFSHEVKFPRLAVVYGKPMHYDGVSKDRESLAKFANEIMQEVAKLKAVGEESVGAKK